MERIKPVHLIVASIIPIVTFINLVNTLRLERQGLTLAGNFEKNVQEQVSMNIQNQDHIIGYVINSFDELHLFSSPVMGICFLGAFLLYMSLVVGYVRQRNTVEES